MKWRVETLNATVDPEIVALPPDVQASFLRLAERIVAVGLERVGEPYVKHLQGELWELQLKGHDGIGRIIYAAARGRRVIVLPAFVQKTPKTPERLLHLAEERATEIG